MRVAIKVKHSFPFLEAAASPKSSSRALSLSVTKAYIVDMEIQNVMIYEIVNSCNRISHAL